MLSSIHLTEQTSREVSAPFLPEDELQSQKEALSRLIAYWQAQEDQARASTGTDRLALTAHHQSMGELEAARQALQSGLQDLAITRKHRIYPTDFGTGGSRVGSIDQALRSKMAGR